MTFKGGRKVFPCSFWKENGIRCSSKNIIFMNPSGVHKSLAHCSHTTNSKLSVQLRLLYWASLWGRSERIKSSRWFHNRAAGLPFCPSVLLFSLSYSCLQYPSSLGAYVKVILAITYGCIFCPTFPLQCHFKGRRDRWKWSLSHLNTKLILRPFNIYSIN